MWNVLKGVEGSMVGIWWGREVYILFVGSGGGVGVRLYELYFVLFFFF